MFEIAGGILLALLVLVLLPIILIAGGWLAMFAVGIALIAGVVWVIATNVANPDFWWAIFYCVAFVGCAYAYRWYNEWRHAPARPGASR